MDLDVGSIAVIPLILAIVSAFKMFTSVKMHKYAPLLSIMLGLLFSWLTVPQDEIYNLKDGILGGLVLGLSASGLYSQTKSFFETTPQRNHS